MNPHHVALLVNRQVTSTPERQQEKLNHWRHAFKEAFPEASENLTWQVIPFTEADCAIELCSEDQKMAIFDIVENLNLRDTTLVVDDPLWMRAADKVAPWVDIPMVTLKSAIKCCLPASAVPFVVNFTPDIERYLSAFDHITLSLDTDFEENMTRIRNAIHDGHTHIIVLSDTSHTYRYHLSSLLPTLNYKDIAAQAVLGDHAVQAQPQRFKVGMIGGLGPMASVDLYEKITKATPAKTDQEHLPLVIYQLPQIPDRTQSLLNQGPNPTLPMYIAAKRLVDAGCDAIIVPCNTAHAFVPALEKRLGVPFIDMQEAALAEIQKHFLHPVRVGLLATTGTCQTHLFHDKADHYAIQIFTPDDAHQALVMDAIYGPRGIKAGFTEGECVAKLLKAAEYLIEEHQVDALILGCTELPLVMQESPSTTIAEHDVMIVDPTAALARKVVQLSQTSNSELDES